MRVRTLTLAAAASLAALTAFAAPAMAQDYRSTYERPAYEHTYDRGEDYSRTHFDAHPGYDRPGFERPGFEHGSFDLRERTERLTEFARRGAEVGWLNGWQARRVFDTLRDVRREAGYARWSGGRLDERERYALNARLDRVQEVLRHAREETRFRRY